VRSPGTAIAWEFRRRHRGGLAALAGYLLALVALRILVLQGWLLVDIDSPERFAAVLVVPLTASVVYLIAVFSFGQSGDLAARQSIYPSRLFTLPVGTAALVGWPMLFGAAAMTALWFATRMLAVWPSGVRVPLVWPALAAVALLAWMQALMWMPYGLPGLRVVVAVLWLGTMDSIVLLAIHFDAPESVMLGILAPQIPLAYVTARIAVARARRGEVPDWRGGLAWPRTTLEALTGGKEDLATPERAQAWFEWRRSGWSLPALVGILLPFEVTLLLVRGGTPILALLVVLGLTPPVMAGFAAATVRKSNPGGGDAYGLTPFTAARPATSAALVAAKLRATIASTLAAWLLVFAAIAVALTASGGWPVVVDRAGQLAGQVGAPRAIGFPLLLIAGLVAATWKQLVQGMYVGLSGRAWAVKASVLLALAVLCLIGPAAQWVHDDRGVQATLWTAIPWILAVLAGLKLAAAAWVAVRLRGSRLLSDRVLVTGAACWCVAVLGLWGLLAWLFAAPFTPRYLLGLVAIVAVPLARLSAAPLALAHNRHR
jgi:hypothetical protein